ncbi:AtpZ/AtpI family protein [Mitsuokella sp. WILCCON 0060]|uniref:AtpZ/AtpI family protein n=1 Tax=unclassified Mitsuokella TaxID=2637239 RepID=UPI003F0632A8
MLNKTQEPKKPNHSHETMRDGLKQAFKAFALLGSMGIYIVVFIGIGIFFGDLADRYFDLGVKGKLVGIIVSIPGAFYTLFRQLRRSGIL